MFRPLSRRASSTPDVANRGPWRRPGPVSDPRSRIRRAGPARTASGDAAAGAAAEHAADDQRALGVRDVRQVVHEAVERAVAKEVELDVRGVEERQALSCSRSHRPIATIADGPVRLPTTGRITSCASQLLDELERVLRGQVAALAAGAVVRQQQMPEGRVVGLRRAAEGSGSGAREAVRMKRRWKRSIVSRSRR